MAISSRNIERVSTNNGANDFVKENPGFLGYFLREIESIRKDYSNTAVLPLLVFLSTVFVYASPETTSALVPKEDLEMLVENLRQTMTRAAKSQEWIHNSRLDEYDRMLLALCMHASRCPDLRNAMFCEEKTSDSCFGAIAKLFAAQDGEHQSFPFALADEFLRLVYSIIHCATCTGIDDVYLRLAQLESCGALAQLFRIMPMNIQDDDVQVEKRNLFKGIALEIELIIESEPRIMATKLCPGTPTGNVLKRVTDSVTMLQLNDDGSVIKVDNKVMLSLKRLQRLADMAGSVRMEHKQQGGWHSRVSCSHCLCAAEKISYCSRCRVAGCK